MERPRPVRSFSSRSLQQPLWVLPPPPPTILLQPLQLVWPQISSSFVPTCVPPPDDPSSPFEQPLGPPHHPPS